VASEQCEDAAHNVENTGPDPDDPEHGKCPPDETRPEGPAEAGAAPVRSCCQPRTQKPPEREALDNEPEPFGEQNRPDREMEHGDRPALRKEQLDVEDEERERGKPTEPRRVDRPDQSAARDWHSGRRIERGL
jgi:hypothetical protein